MTPDEQFSELTGHLVQLMERMSFLTEAHAATEREMRGLAEAQKDLALVQATAHEDLAAAQKDLTAAQTMTEKRLAQALEMHVKLGNIISIHDTRLDGQEERLDILEDSALKPPPPLE